MTFLYGWEGDVEIIEDFPEKIKKIELDHEEHLLIHADGVYNRNLV